MCLFAIAVDLVSCVAYIKRSVFTLMITLVWLEIVIVLLYLIDLITMLTGEQRGDTVTISLTTSTIFIYFISHYTLNR